MLLDDIEHDFLSELESELAKNDVRDIWDTIHEIADRHIPIWYVDLLSLASFNLWLAVDEPELKASNAVQSIQYNLYDHLVTLGYEKHRELMNEN